jgi:hypothetical protein
VLRAQGQDDAKRRSQRSRRMREVVFRVLVERPGHLEAQAETLPIHRPVSTHLKGADLGGALIAQSPRQHPIWAAASTMGAF